MFYQKHIIFYHFFNQIHIICYQIPIISQQIHKNCYQINIVQIIHILPWLCWICPGVARFWVITPECDAHIYQQIMMNNYDLVRSFFELVQKSVHSYLLRNVCIKFWSDDSKMGTLQLSQLQIASSIHLRGIQSPL